MGVLLREMTDIPLSVRYMFLAAGWSVNRQVQVPTSVPAIHPAHPILQEFGGLRVGRTGPGQECAASDVAFQEIPSDSKLVRFWSDLLRTQLIGVAEVHNRHGELYLDSDGRWYTIGISDDAMCFVGSSFEEVMERLLLGHRCRPMLRPGQKQVTLYGEVIASGDPRVYRYTTS
jgi:SUKH-3 immunity protein